MAASSLPLRSIIQTQMATQSSVFSPLLLALFLALVTGLAVSRPISPVVSQSGSTADLIARLKLVMEDPGTPSCWDSLFQLQACTEEVIAFFLNGETHLGHHCCRAIRTIEQHCWPGLIGALGFTAEEGNILEGYCIAAIEPDG